MGGREGGGGGGGGALLWIGVDVGGVLVLCAISSVLLVQRRADSNIFERDWKV